MPYAPEHCNSSGVAERDLVKPDPLWQRATESQESKRSWKYFLTLIKFSHVPYGCGASASASPPSLKGHLLLSFCVSLSLSLCLLQGWSAQSCCCFTDFAHTMLL